MILMFLLLSDQTEDMFAIFCFFFFHLLISYLYGFPNGNKPFFLQKVWVIFGGFFRIRLHLWPYSYQYYFILDCNDNYFGYNCINKCSGHCLNDAPCNKQTGHCDRGCNPGFKNSFCNDSTWIGLWRVLFKMCKISIKMFLKIYRFH